MRVVTGRSAGPNPEPRDSGFALCAPRDDKQINYHPAAIPPSTVKITPDV